MEHGNIIIYKDKNGLNNIEVKMVDNNVWLNQEQLVNLYNSSKSNISEHIKHIFEEHELEEGSVVRKFRTTAKDGKSYNIKYYNLDMIVAIGFRVKSNIGTNFRIWANERLTEYIQKGFTMNDNLLNDFKKIWIINAMISEMIPKNYDEKNILIYKYDKPKYHINGYEMREHINNSKLIKL